VEELEFAQKELQTRLAIVEKALIMFGTQVILGGNTQTPKKKPKSVVPRKRSTKAEMLALGQKISEYMFKAGLPCSAGEIAAALQVSEGVVYWVIQKGVTGGQVQKTGRGFYALSEATRASWATGDMVPVVKSNGKAELAL